MNEDLDLFSRLISNRSKKLGKFFSSNEDGTSVNEEISGKLKNLPESQYFYVMYSLFSAIRQTSKMINDESEETVIDAIFSNYFIKYIQSNTSDEFKDEIYKIFCIDESVNYRREISSEELSKIKKFYYYYREFYVRSKENDNDKLFLLSMYCDNDEFITSEISIYDTNKSNLNLSFQIPLSFNLFLPYDEAIKEINEFSENVKFFTRNIYSILEGKLNDDSFPDINNYINFSYNGSNKNTYHDMFDRFLYIYDNMDKKWLTEDKNFGIDVLCKKVQKKFKIRRQYSPSKLREHTTSDYYLAADLIELARTGKFPGKH